MRLAIILVASVFLATATLVQAQEKPDSQSQSLESMHPKITEIDGKNLQQWIKDLKDRDPSVRVLAIQAIMRFGKDGMEAGPALIDCLDDQDTSIRVNATLALVTIDVAAKDIPRAVTAMTTRLKIDQQAIVRLYAANCLAKFGADAKPAMPVLVDRVRDQSSWEIRKGVVAALRAAAYDKENGPDMRAVNALTYLLTNDYSSQVRLAAAMTLGSLGRPSQPADKRAEEQAILRALNDKDKTVVIWSYVALLAIEDNTEEKHLIALAKFLKSNQPFLVRVHAARAIGTIGKRAKTRIHDLVEVLSDKEDGIAASASWALGQMGELSDKHLADIARLLKSPEKGVRMHAVQALGTIGPKAKPRLSDVVEAMKDKEPLVVTAAAWAIGQMGEMEEEHLLNLAALLKHEEIPVRTQTVQTIGSLGSKAKSRIPNLIDTLKDKEPIVVGGAAWALGQMGEAGQVAIPALETLKQQKGIDEGVKEMATQAIDNIRGRKAAAR